MDVISITRGGSKYEKVLIQLHGGGGSSAEWYKPYELGYYGNMTGIKLVWPTSYRPGHTWYQDFKDPNCGFEDDCAYNISTIQESGKRI